MLPLLASLKSEKQSGNGICAPLSLSLWLPLSLCACARLWKSKKNNGPAKHLCHKRDVECRSTDATEPIKTSFLVVVFIGLMPYSSHLRWPLASPLIFFYLAFVFEVHTYWDNLKLFKMFSLVCCSFISLHILLFFTTSFRFYLFRCVSFSLCAPIIFMCYVGPTKMPFSSVRFCSFVPKLIHFLVVLPLKANWTKTEKAQLIFSNSYGHFII